MDAGAISVLAAFPEERPDQRIAGQLTPVELTEQLVFPELNPDKYTRVQGMNVTFVTSVDSNDEARELLAGFGMPFRREEGKPRKSGAA